MEGKMEKCSLGTAFAVLKTDRLHCYNVLCSRVTAWTINMKRFALRTEHNKYAAIRAGGHLRGTLGRPSDDLDASKHFFKKAFQLRTFFLAVFGLPSRWSRDTVEMQGIELATIFVAPSAFQHFCERDPRALIGVF